MHNECNKAEQEHLNQKIQENVLLLNCKAHAKIQALINEKKINDSTMLYKGDVMFLLVDK